MEPVFRRKRNGALLLADTDEARAVLSEQRQKHYEKALPAAKVREIAVKAVLKKNGDIDNRKHLLGQFTLQFGRFRNTTFQWLLSNALGYAAYLVVSLEKDKPSEDARWLNKMALQKYLKLFPEGEEAVVMKRKERITTIPAKVVRDELSDTDDHELLDIVEKMEHDAEDFSELHPSGFCQNLPSERGDTFKESDVVDASVTTDVSLSTATTSSPDLPLEYPLPSDKPKTKWSKRAASSAPKESIRQMMFSPVPGKKLRTEVTAQTSPYTTMPQTSPYTTMPQTSPYTTMPQTSPYTTMPQTSPYTTMPQTSPYTTMPQTSPYTTMPQTSPCTTMPQTNPCTTMPQTSPYTTMPQTSPYTTMPQTSPYTTMPQTSPYTTMPQTSPYTTMPQTSPCTTMPQTSPCTSTRPTSTDQASSATTSLDTRYPIYAKWRDSIPEEDVRWISKALFTTVTDKRGERAHLILERVTKMWWYPPEPPFLVQGRPSVEQYFGHRLFLWMPHKLWHVSLKCPHESCHDIQLTASGIYNKLRRVVDISSIYLLASEYLQCPSCKRKVIAWNHNIISQLDIPKQQVFPCILTSMKACDKKVVRLLRERGLGNSSSQIQKKLHEGHSEEWLSKTTQYLSDCMTLKRASSSGLVAAFTCQDPPTMLPVPQFRWLMQVYIQDVLFRLEETKAEVTSVFGRVLKMDSTKKIVGKLAGPVRGTALWASNIGNEYGQVLMSVVTAGEGHGLGLMANGIMKRYRDADVVCPEVLYVDRDCCGSSPVRTLFHEWKDIPIRLDIWHFMRRMSGGCSTDSHPLYGSLMNGISRCIFMWDQDDLEALKEAKRQELRMNHVNLRDDADLMNHIKKQELALHCRRTTRGADVTLQLISKLLDGYRDAKDTLGVPLLKVQVMDTIWAKQQKHLPCIQDPPGVQLYIKTGSLRKGSTVLPTYRCARGSTSLESFHLHMNRFIPGSLANDVLYQAYLVEGLSRWNQNRRADATLAVKAAPHSYSQLLRDTANSVGEAVLGRKIIDPVTSARKYTGELIGLDYLLHQTGKSLEYTSFIDALENADDIHPDLPDEIDDATTCMDDLDSELCTTATLEVEDVQKPNQSGKTAPVPPIVSILTQAEEMALFEDYQHIATPLTLEQPRMQTAASSIIVEKQTTVCLDDSVGPDNLPGYAAIQDLAKHLVSMVDGNLCLSSEQAAHTIQLWNALSPHDQRRTVFAERYNPQATHKFRAPKKIIQPGVQSTECSVRAPDSIPAAKPDCNRYVEAVVQRLCSMFTSSRTSQGRTKTRWSLIMEAYNKIHTTIHNNAVVMDCTDIQLPSLNQRTLQAWHNNKLRQENVKMLSQGLSLPKPEMTAPHPLLTPITLPAKLQVGPAQQENPLRSPPNTAGSVKPKKKLLKHKVSKSVSASQTTTTTQVSNPESPLFVVVPQQAPVQTSMPVSSPDIHYQTMRYRRIKSKEMEEGKVRRKYVQSKSHRTCKKCGDTISKDTHKNLWGALHCPKTSTETLEEFTARRINERAARMKQKKD